LNFLKNKPFVAGTGQVSDSDDEPDVLIIQSTPTLVVPIVDSEEADRVGLAFPSLNPILGVGTASISSFVYAGRPTGSAGRPVSACRPTGFARRLVSTGNLTGSAGRPFGSIARTPIPAGRILGKLPSNTPSKRFLRASSMENSYIHNGLKIFDYPKSGIFTSSSYDEEFSRPDANNLASSVDVSSTITKRIHNIHPTSQILGDINSPVQTRSQVKHKGSSKKEPTTMAQALADPDWVEAMQVEMQLFRNQKVWVLVTLPNGKRAIGTKWILKNKRDARGIVCKNKARLVAQGHRQEEGIDYTNFFAPVAKIKAI
nr:hypothetical protein [Tanacetum cinerariifolium]